MFFILIVARKNLMKFAVLTYCRNNYGALLQTWVLQATSRQMGHAAVLIDSPVRHQPHSFLPRIFARLGKHLLFQLLKKGAS